MTARRAHRGFTLAEMMVYTAVVSIVITVAWLTYYACWGHSLVVLRASGDIVRTLEAGERWRNDVRGASEPPTLADGVLRIPHASGAVGYRVAGETVERRVGEGAWTPHLVGVRASRMVLDAGQRVRSWRWEVELKVRKKQARVRPLFTFRAVAAEGSR